MEIINITEDQRNELCDILARLTCRFKQDESVECIYFAPYTRFGDINDPVISLTIVRKGIILEESKKIVENYNRFFLKDSNFKKLGVKISIDVDSARYYTTLDLNPSEERRTNLLFNSSILFDRTGEYTKIQEQATEGTGCYHYSTLGKIMPLLTNQLNDSMESRQMQQDTDSFKGFVKSKLFQDIINM